MATTNTLSNPEATGTGSVPALLVSLAPLAQEAFEATLANLAAAFPDQYIVVATPDGSPQTGTQTMQIVGSTPSAPSTGSWTLDCSGLSHRA